MIPANRLRPDGEPDPLGVLTLVLWLCLAAGAGLGFWLPYPRPVLPKREVPVMAESVQAELRGVEPPPPAEPPMPKPLAMPPPLAESAVPLPAPPAVAVAVARPDPAVAFALPLPAEAPVPDARPAAGESLPVDTRPIAGTPEAPRPVRLVFGEGEGRQASPEYPRAALRQGQEGTVVIRIEVGADGGVVSATLETPSPWPLLNQAALRVVRERWRFRPGQKRLYDAPIRFEITP